MTGYKSQFNFELESSLRTAEIVMRRDGLTNETILKYISLICENYEFKNIDVDEKSVHIITEFKKVSSLFSLVGIESLFLAVHHDEVDVVVKYSKNYNGIYESFTARFYRSK